MYVLVPLYWYVSWQLECKGELKVEFLWLNIGEGVSGVLTAGTVAGVCRVENVSTCALHAYATCADVWLMHH